MRKWHLLRGGGGKGFWDEDMLSCKLPECGSCRGQRRTFSDVISAVSTHCTWTSTARTQRRTRRYVQGPKKWFAECNKHYPSRFRQTSLPTEVTNFTKPRTSHFFGLCISFLPPPFAFLRSAVVQDVIGIHQTISCCSYMHASYSHSAQLLWRRVQQQRENWELQDWTKRLFPGCVKFGEKLRFVYLLQAGTHKLFTLIHTTWEERFSPVL